MFRPVLPRSVNILSNTIIAMALILAPGYIAYDYLSMQRRPRVIRSIWIDPVVATQGSKIEVHVRASVFKACRSQVQRWIVNAADNRPVWTSIEPGQAATVSEDSLFVVPLNLNDEIAPGNYYYKSLVYDTCPSPRGDETYTTSPPFVYFRVLPRGGR